MPQQAGWQLAGTHFQSSPPRNAAFNSTGHVVHWLALRGAEPGLFGAGLHRRGGSPDLHGLPRGLLGTDATLGVGRGLKNVAAPSFPLARIKEFG